MSEHTEPPAKTIPLEHYRETFAKLVAAMSLETSWKGHAALCDDAARALTNVLDPSVMPEKIVASCLTLIKYFKAASGESKKRRQESIEAAHNIAAEVGVDAGSIQEESDKSAAKLAVVARHSA